jgi:hypothetical protein
MLTLVQSLANCSLCFQTSGKVLIDLILLILDWPDEVVEVSYSYSYNSSTSCSLSIVKYIAVPVDPGGVLVDPREHLCCKCPSLLQ